MKALKTIIISAVLFLGLQSQTFATDEQEDMGLVQQIKPGFSELLIHLKVQACDDEETEDALDEKRMDENNDHAAVMEVDDTNSLSMTSQAHNDLQLPLLSNILVPAEDSLKAENNIKVISSSRKRKRSKPSPGKNQAEEEPLAKRINQEPDCEQTPEGFAKLPIELQEYIFSFLDQKEFMRAFLVCKSWREIARMSEGERSLNLSNRKLEQKDCYALLRVPFSMLILERCQLGDQGACILSQSVRAKGLNLAYNSIGAEGAEALAAGNLSALTSLNLYDNSIGAEGAKAIATGNLSTLISLNLGDNSIGDTGVQALASGNLTALTSLDLENSGIEKAGAQALASGNLTALISLNLQDNDIRDEGAKAIAAGNLSALTSLDLYNNYIGDVGAEALVSGNLTALISLNLYSNNITEKGKRAFEKLKFVECENEFDYDS